jgi:hypothetical protein
MTTETKTEILATMPKGEAQIRAIFGNPGLNNKEVALLVRAVYGEKAGELGEKTVAWYRSHARKGDLGKALMAVVNELGGPSAVPSASRAGTSAPAPRREMTPDEMVEALRAAGCIVIEAPAEL